MTKENKNELNEQMQNLEKEISEKKEMLKELQSKHTFKGLYAKLCGRSNILKGIQESNLSDEDKYTEAVATLKAFAEEY